MNSTLIQVSTHVHTYEILIRGRPRRHIQDLSAMEFNHRRHIDSIQRPVNDNGGVRSEGCGSYSNPDNGIYVSRFFVET